MQDRFVRDKERTGKDAVNGGRRALLLAALCLTTGNVRAADDRVLRIGVDADYPPFTFYDDMRTFTGIDPVLAREACRRLGVTPEFIPIAWDRKDELFADKKIDCVWSCFSMTGRESLYRWVPYLYSRQVVVVRNSSPIQCLKDLTGKTVAVQAGTRPEQIFTREAARVPAIADLLTFPTTAEAFTAVRRRYADATAGHEAVMRRLLKEVPGHFRILDEPLLAVKVGVAFPLDTDKTAFIERLRKAFVAMTFEGFVERTATDFGLDGKKAALVPAGHQGR